MTTLLLSIFSGFAVLLPLTVSALISERSGILNIGLEGYCNLGAFSYVWMRTLLPALPAGIAACFLVVLSALLFDAYSQNFSVDHFIVGLAVNLLVSGLIPQLSELIFATKGSVYLPETASKYLLTVQAGGTILGGFRVVEFVAILTGAALLVFLAATPQGLHISALGMNKKAVELAGLNAAVIRHEAAGLSALGAAVSGIVLVGGIGAWVPNISSGKGWIALVLVYLGGKSIAGMIIACLLFSIFLASALGLQRFALIMPEALQAAPYILISVVILAYSQKNRKKQERTCRY